MKTKLKKPKINMPLKEVQVLMRVLRLQAKNQSKLWKWRPSTRKKKND